MNYVWNKEACFIYILMIIILVKILMVKTSILIFLFFHSTIIGVHCCSHSTHSLVFWPLCLLSGALAKWMLCLQHVLVLSSGVCAQVRLSGSVRLPWQQCLGKCVCVLACTMCQFWGPAGFSEIARARLCACLSDVTVRGAAISCCSRVKRTVLSGLIN